MPVRSKIILVKVDIISIGIVSAPRPVRTVRKPSTTLAMGFRLYSTLEGSSSPLEEYTTGVTNNHICIRNGTIYRTSRYRTFRADSHRLTPRAVATHNSVKAGIKTTDDTGGT